MAYSSLTHPLCGPVLLGAVAVGKPPSLPQRLVFVRLPAYSTAQPLEWAARRTSDDDDINRNGGLCLSDY